MALELLCRIPPDPFQTDTVAKGGLRSCMEGYAGSEAQLRVWGLYKGIDVVASRVFIAGAGA